CTSTISSWRAPLATRSATESRSTPFDPPALITARSGTRRAYRLRPISWDEVDGDGSAHGRVNLIGEHTDYNDGLVLPTLIPQRTVVAVRSRTDHLVTVRTDARGSAPVEIVFDTRAPRHDWSDHVIGVADSLARRGHELRGFDALVRSDIPIGAGLASSAALAVATGR